jgi:transmembrane sensor
MIESRLTYLYQAYFNKTASPNERDELMELLLQFENDEQVKTLLAETWQQFNSQSQLFNDSQGEDMLANILQKGTAKKPAPVISTYKRSFRRLHIAAAAAILLFTFTGVYFWLKPQEPVRPLVQSKTITKDVKNAIVRGGNKAVLTLCDGSSIVLDSTNQGTLATQGNAKVMKLNTATLAYNAGDENNQEVVYNTLSTPSGGQYQLILPDGTRVWLNASSSIHFPTLFKGKERKVTVTGEAYFEVTPLTPPTGGGQRKIPFIVKINTPSGDGGQIQVLGTHFNIMAYEDESSMNTTLLEGSVKVTKGSLSKMLVPGQQSRINKTGDIKVVEADIEEVIAWKNGWFQFNAYDIEKVMRQISRWYNVEIVYESIIPTGHFSGSVSRDNDISQVLKIMQRAGVRFRIEGRKVIVLP